MNHQHVHDKCSTTPHIAHTHLICNSIAPCLDKSHNNQAERPALLHNILKLDCNGSLYNAQPPTPSSQACYSVTSNDIVTDYPHPANEHNNGKAIYSMLALSTIKQKFYALRLFYPYTKNKLHDTTPITNDLTEVAPVYSNPCRFLRLNRATHYGNNSKQAINRREFPKERCLFSSRIVTM